jgi:hypothetical protein
MRSTGLRFTCKLAVARTENIEVTISIEIRRQFTCPFKPVPPVGILRVSSKKSRKIKSKTNLSNQT